VIRFEDGSSVEVSPPTPPIQTPAPDSKARANRSASSKGRASD
jgi:hypothetical protein